MDDSIDIDTVLLPEESLEGLRRAPNGDLYRAPPPGKRVIRLDEDCGFLLRDRAFEELLFGPILASANVCTRARVITYDQFLAYKRRRTFGRP